MALAVQPPWLWHWLGSLGWLTLPTSILFKWRSLLAHGTTDQAVRSGGWRRTLVLLMCALWRILLILSLRRTLLIVPRLPLRTSCHWHLRLVRRAHQSRLSVHLLRLLRLLLPVLRRHLLPLSLMTLLPHHSFISSVVPRRRCRIVVS